jgi:hypothetical protein
MRGPTGARGSKCAHFHALQRSSRFQRRIRRPAPVGTGTRSRSVQPRHRFCAVGFCLRGGRPSWPARAGAAGKDPSPVPSRYAGGHPLPSERAARKAAAPLLAGEGGARCTEVLTERLIFNTARRAVFTSLTSETAVPGGRLRGRALFLIIRGRTLETGGESCRRTSSKSCKRRSRRSSTS